MKMRPLSLAIIGAGCVLGISAAVVGFPATAAPLTGGVVALTLFAAIRQNASQVTRWALTILLVGYMAFGRGVAYVGVPPLYIGEIVLSLGMLTVLSSWGRAMKLPKSVLIGLGLFMAVGAASTIPYLGKYGLDALRDSVVWVYALYVPIAYLSYREDGGTFLIRIYDAISGILPWWVLSVAILKLVAPDIAGVRLAGSPSVLLGMKAGDTAVHLLGAAAFRILRLRIVGRGTGSLAFGTIWWFAWLAALVVYSNRAGLLACLSALILLALFRTSAAWIRLLSAAGLSIATMAILDLSVTVAPGKVVSLSSLTERILSIVDSDTGNVRLDATRQWRLDWWQEILNYTFLGPYLLTGKGYGINLADADGFQVTSDKSLRSPHNGHLTVLARSGAPGLATWIVLQMVLIAQIGRIYRRAVRNGDIRAADLSLWLTCYWLAFMVNISFDVVLEGPHGGIWYWSILGMALGIARSSRHKHVAWQGKL